jgi:tetratricopeptide (TPR) repeat protein
MGLFRKSNLSKQIVDGIMNIQEGTDAAQAGDFKEAVNRYTLSLSEVPDNTSVLLMRAMAFYGLKEYEKALADIYKALSFDASMPDAYSSKALIEWTMGDTKAALVDYDKAISMEPDSISLMNRGQVKRDTGDLKGAVKDLKEAVKLDPENALANQILMICQSFSPEVYKLFMEKRK